MFNSTYGVHGQVPFQGRYCDMRHGTCDMTSLDRRGLGVQFRTSVQMPWD
jgi:hypothetical protein